MEFELLNLNEGPYGPLEALRRYLENPRRQMQAWGEKAPVLLGAAVLWVVSLELSMAHRIGAGTGDLLAAVAQATTVMGGVMLVEFVVIGAASSVAGLFDKTGRPIAAFTYLNLELMPLLMWLPVSLLVQAMRWPDGIRFFALAGILLRVLSRWRDVLQTVFRLTRLQTYLALYGTVTAAGTLMAAVLYVSVLVGVLSLLNG